MFENFLCMFFESMKIIEGVHVFTPIAPSVHKMVKRLLKNLAASTLADLVDTKCNRVEHSSCDYRKL